MRSPKPPAPMKAAMVAVPTVITAEVFTPAMIVARASGNSIKRKISDGVMASDFAASLMPTGICDIPVCVLRTIGNSA